MELSLPLSEDGAHFRRRTGARGSLLAWTLCGLVALHAWLLPLITDPRALDTVVIQLLQPLASLGAIGLLLVAAWREGRSARRWAWLLQALAMLISAGGVLLQIAARAQGTPIVTPQSDLLFLLTYAVALFASALYLPRHVWWIGSTARLILDGVVISIAAFVVLQSVLPGLLHPWTPQSAAQVIWLALDMGVIFVTGVLCLRYGRRGSPLLLLVFLSLVTLLIGDSFFLLISTWPDAQLWYFVPGPLYALHRVLLAFGAYAGVTQAPQTPPVATLMPAVEWWTWTMAPAMLALIALLSQAPIGSPLLVLITLLLVRELLVALDQRRVTGALHTAEEQERHTNALVRQQKAAVEESNHQLRTYMVQAEDLAVEQERVRVAREIHDGIGHHLNNIKVHSEVAHRSFAAHPATALDALSTVKDEIRNAQRELRRAIEALVSDEYLASPLEELLSVPIRDCQLDGVAVAFQVLGAPRPVSQQVKQGLYRIGQEALNNIRKHAGAKQAALTLDYQAQQIRLSIEDDGIGMPTIERRRGHGLDNLQERAARIGGKTDIETRPGKGVRIVVEVPI